MYVLVLLRDVDPDEAAEIDHEPFVDSLIERNLVLLGGGFATEPVPGVSGAYVLRCESVGHAREIVAEDPLVTGDACEAILAQWELVGVNLAAIDRPQR